MLAPFSRFILVVEELPEFLAGRFDFLGLQSGLDHVERVGDEASDAASTARADEVPEEGVGLVPRLEVGLQVLVHAHHRRGEGDVHGHRDGVRPVQREHPFLLDDVPQALRRRQFGAQLQPLLHHIARRDEEVVRERGQCPDECRVQELVPLVVVVEVLLQELVRREIGSVGGDAPARDHLSALPETEQAFLGVEGLRRLEELETVTTRLQVGLFTKNDIK